VVPGLTNSEFHAIIRDIVKDSPCYGEGDDMAELKPGEMAPATGKEPTGTKFPEDELAEIERKADEKAGKKADGSPATDAGTPPEDTNDDASVEKLQTFMKKKGINDVGKLVDLAADLESKNTKLVQENTRLSAIPRVSGGTQPEGFARPVVTVDDDIEVPENPIELVTKPGELKKFAKKLIDFGDQRAAKREQQRSFGDAAAQVQAKMEANPEEFQRLKPTMIEFAKANPGANIEQIYSAAKEQYGSDRKALVAEIKAELGLSGSDTEKLRGIVGRVRQAPITSGSGNQVTVATQRQAEKDAKDLLTAINNSDKF
jgi:hypothetical protein